MCSLRASIFISSEDLLYALLGINKSALDGITSIFLAHVLSLLRVSLFLGASSLVRNLLICIPTLVFLLWERSSRLWPCS